MYVCVCVCMCVRAGVGGRGRERERERERENKIKKDERVERKMKLNASRLCHVLFTGAAFHTYARTYTQARTHTYILRCGCAFLSGMKEEALKLRRFSSFRPRSLLTIESPASFSK